MSAMRPWLSDSVAVDAVLVSEAVVVWTGKGEYSWPHRDDDRVLATYGEERALDLLPRIKALYDEFYESTARLTAPNLAATGDAAAAPFREQHPELSEAAVEALAWCYTFDFK